jgi:predicted aconitase with swiveling domain
MELTHATSHNIYGMQKQGTAPAAIVNRETEANIATGCVMTGILRI